MQPVFYCLPQSFDLIPHAPARYAAGFLHKTLHDKRGNAFDFVQSTETKYRELYGLYYDLQHSILQPLCVTFLLQFRF